MQNSLRTEKSERKKNEKQKIKMYIYAVNTDLSLFFIYF